MSYTTRKKIIISVSVTLASMLIIALFVWIFTPKIKTGVITDITWKRTIDIEKYTTVIESDWSVPYGGRVLYHSEEIYMWVEEFDHYETYSEWVEVFDHYEEVVIGYEYDENGNMYEVVDYEPVYREELQTWEEPVYVDVPIYQTWYTYEIERWLHERYETAEGHGTNPYWPEFQLRENEREGRQKEIYAIIVCNDKGKENKYTLTKDEWSRLTIGQEVKLKTYINGSAKLIID